LEERRTQAVMSRRWLAPESAAEIGRLDPEAIARVRAEAWPDAANADELHDALVWLGLLTAEEAATDPAWSGWLAELARDKRVTRLTIARPPAAFLVTPAPFLVTPAQAGVQGPLDSRFRGNDEEPVSLWVAAERLLQFQALWPEARLEPPIATP